MKSLLILCLAVVALTQEFVVTKEYVDYLKRHVTWEVAEYEDNIFRGWTIEEVSTLLGRIDGESEPVNQIEVDPDEVLPSSINWMELSANCIHSIRNQGHCGSCWAFSASSVVSDRCCLKKQDYGWLSPQELVSCDRMSHGCNGGYEDRALNYVGSNGLVKEECFPYKAVNLACPTRCADGSNWKDAHVCKCQSRHTCNGPEAMAKCITTGPVTAGMYVYQDFMSYKSGIYHWDKTSKYLGGHAVRCYGYAEKPEFHWICANSWGEVWGDKGSFKIGKGQVRIDTWNPSYCDPVQ